MSTSCLPPDKIVITDLSLAITISNDHWSRPLPQPHVLNLTIIHPTAVSGATDTLPTTINYSTAAKAVTKHVQDRSWTSLEECAEQTAGVLRGLGAGRVGVRIAATKVLAGGWVELEIWRGGQGREKDTIKLREIAVRCIIGINPQERLEKQTVIVDLEAPLPVPAPDLATSTGFPHKILSDAVHDVSHASSL
jgi:dihydroneopterin aldolase/2-amino-4-hydroxy-6-hydroxymethyldihydropteridine diphosphokinase/dihydropteroate synthase